MAVVINEFEVITGDSDPGKRADPSSTGEMEERTMPSPQEFERVLEQKLARCERVWAH